MCVRQAIYVRVAGHLCVCDRASMCVRHMYMCQILYGRERKKPYECEGNRMRACRVPLRESLKLTAVKVKSSLHEVR